MSEAIKLYVVESALGTWSYHLSTTGKCGRATLCGKHNVMSTAVPLTSWNKHTEHLHDSFCAECSEIAAKLGVVLPHP